VHERFQIWLDSGDTSPELGLNMRRAARIEQRLTGCFPACYKVGLAWWKVKPGRRKAFLSPS